MAIAIQESGSPAANTYAPGPKPRRADLVGAVCTLLAACVRSGDARRCHHCQVEVSIHMNEYLSIWRLLPRATIGLALALVVLLACRGISGLQTLKAAIQFVTGLKSDFVALAVGVLALAVISNIGWQFANIASSALGTAFDPANGVPANANRARTGRTKLNAQLTLV